MAKIVVFTDGGCRDNPGPGSWAFVIKDGENKEEYSGFLPYCTNNQAEYRGLEAACILISKKELAPESVEIFSDSQLVVEQINGCWQVKDSGLKPFYDSAKAAFKGLKEVCPVSLSWVGREFNQEADALCNKCMDHHGIVCSKKGRKRGEVYE